MGRGAFWSLAAGSLGLGSGEIGGGLGREGGRGQGRDLGMRGGGTGSGGKGWGGRRERGSGKWERVSAGAAQAALVRCVKHAHGSRCLELRGSESRNCSSLRVCVSVSLVPQITSLLRLDRSW